MKKRLLTILTALTLLLTVAVMTTVAFATDSTTYDITNISYIDSFGVCNVTWSDTGDPGGYFVKAYSTDDTSSPIYTAMVTDAYIFVRLFATDGGTYFVTVTPVNGSTTVTSTTFTYDASKDATYPYVIYSASYDSDSQRMSWNVYGSVYGFRVDAYEYGGTSPVYSAYTTSTYISASEIFPANGSYYFKIWIVDSSGNNISDSTAWICVRTGAYEYTGYTTATVIFDANGGFFNDNDDYTQYYAHADSSGTVTFPTNQFKLSNMLEGWYTAAEGGDLVTASTTFTSDTTLYAHWVTCDHAGQGGSTCDISAICSVCGDHLPYAHTMTHINAVAPTCSEDGTLECYYCSTCCRYYSSADGYPEELLDDITDPATGDHTYDENNKCTYCGTIGASTNDRKTDTSTGTVRSVLSVTAADNSTNAALADVVNSSSVTSSTVTMSRTSQLLTGTLSVSQVSTSNISAPGVISVTDSLGTLNLGNAISSGANITAGTTLSGTYTDTSSGDVTPMKGEVLFYGNISYSDESVIEKSTFSISLTPTSTLDLDSLSLLHYDTTSSAWEQLAISSATKDTSGAVTLTFQTSSLSPFMVLTTGVNYGTVTVGGVTLSDGEYLISGPLTIYSGDPESYVTALSEGYAYYKDGILTLYNYTLSTSSGGISADESLTIVLEGNNYIKVTGANGICADGDIAFTGDGSLTLTVENDGTVYGIKSGGDITIAEATIEVEATVTTGNDGSAYGIYADGDVTIYDGSTVNVTASSSSRSYSIEATNGISITDGSTVEAESKVSSEYGRATAIFANSDAVIISESEVTAYVTSGVAGQAIMSYGSNVEISSSEVTATVSSTVGASSSYGIYAQADVIITGSDSEITSTVTAASDSSYAFPIYAINNISITGGSVDATATNSGTNGKAYGIYSRNGDTAISDSASIEATASSDSGDAFGIYAATDVSISGSEVTATAESDGDSATASAIYSRAGEITIDDGSVVEASVTGEFLYGMAIYTHGYGSDITISGTGTEVTATTNSTSTYDYREAYAIFLFDGALVIEDGSKVDATAATVAGCYSASEAIYAPASATVDQSTLTATASGDYPVAITAYEGMTLQDSKVTATASGASAVTIQTYILVISGSESEVEVTAEGTINAIAILSSEAMTVENSSKLTVKATGTDSGYGILTFGNITISASEVDVTAEGDEAYAIYALYLRIEEDSTVAAAITSTGTDSYAIYTESNLTISVSEVEATGGVKVDGEVTLDTSSSYVYEVKAGSSASALEEVEQVDASTLATIYQNLIASYSYVNVTMGNHLHTYGNPTYTWSDDYSTVTGVFTCTESGCTSTVTITVDTTVSSVLGQTIYKATFTVGDETFTATKTFGTSLLVIQADYSAVTLAIARANGLDASSYSNFETVTAAIDAVQWGLNVLNQPLVTSYADAINEAIDSLVLADIVEETVEINEPVEGTDTVTEPDDEPEEVEVNDTEPEANPTTGIMISLMAIATAAAAAGVSKRR